jgi:hypothetical protein
MEILSMVVSWEQGFRFHVFRVACGSAVPSCELDTELTFNTRLIFPVVNHSAATIITCCAGGEKKEHVTTVHEVNPTKPWVNHSNELES